jgi:hypothetical protein
MKLSRKEFFLLLKGHLNENKNIAYEKIEEIFSEKMKYPVTISSIDRLTLSSLVTCLRKRWKLVHRNESHFFFKYRKWLKVFVDLDLPQKITTGNYNFNIIQIY